MESHCGTPWSSLELYSSEPNNQQQQRPLFVFYSSSFRASPSALRLQSKEYWNILERKCECRSHRRHPENSCRSNIMFSNFPSVTPSITKNIQIILEGKATCRSNGIKPRLLVPRRVILCCQMCDFIYAFDVFLRRRHVAFPSRIISRFCFRVKLNNNLQEPYLVWYLLGFRLYIYCSLQG